IERQIAEIPEINKGIDNEISQLKQELERVEGPEGFGALKPIYNFYENTVANILKKQGYNPVEITDEYGNTWNEVTIKKDRDSSEIYYDILDASKSAADLYFVNKDLFTANQQQEVIK